MKQKNKDAIVKERILNNAESLFAQKGFRGVTVREIINAANCNLSAVNYYFGNKKNLYLEVFRARLIPRSKRMCERFKKFLCRRQPSDSPAAVVEALAQAFLEGPLSDDERQRHYQLMVREMSQPGEAFDLVFEHVMQPLLQDLSRRLRLVITEEIEEERLILNIESILGMIIHFNYFRPAITRFTGHAYDSSFKERLIEHIIDFSLYGLGVGKKEALP